MMGKKTLGFESDGRWQTAFQRLNLPLYIRIEITTAGTSQPQVPDAATQVNGDLPVISRWRRQGYVNIDIQGPIPPHVSATTRRHPYLVQLIQHAFKLQAGTGGPGLQLKPVPDGSVIDRQRPQGNIPDHHRQRQVNPGKADITGTFIIRFRGLQGHCNPIGLERVQADSFFEQAGWGPINFRSLHHHAYTIAVPFKALSLPLAKQGASVGLGLQPGNLINGPGRSLFGMQGQQNQPNEHQWQKQQQCDDQQQPEPPAPAQRLFVFLRLTFSLLWWHRWMIGHSSGPMEK